MNFLVRDTKKPNREPFLISEVGFKGLQAQFGGRYVRVNSHIDVTKLPEVVKIPSVPKIEKKEETKELFKEDLRHEVRAKRRRK